MRAALHGYGTSGVWWVVLWLACLLALAASGAHAQVAVSKVVLLRGEAQARLSGAEARRLQEGSEIHLGDRVTTGRDTLLHLGFTDNTQVFLGSHSEFVVEQFDARKDEPAFVAEIGKGVFRVVTGLIAKLRPQAVRIVTPVSTIGIRGTNFGGEVTFSSATIVLLEPEEAGQRTGIEVYNSYGSVTIEEPGFGTEVPDANSPPSPPRRMRVRAIDNLMRTLTNIQRIQIPRGGPK